MATPPANPPRLTAPRPQGPPSPARAKTPASACSPAPAAPPATTIAELRRQWSAARRGDVWALLAALDRSGLARTLHHDPGWIFAPDDVHALAGDDDVLAIHTSFLGLLGVDTPLPSYALDAIEAAPLLRSLVEAVERRLLELLHRAVQRCAYPATCSPARDDPTSRRLIDFVVAGVVDRPRHADLPPRAWLHLLRWTPARLRTASGLATALSHLFAADLGNAAITLVECVPRTGELPASARSHLGGPTTALGRRFVLGDRAPDGAGWFRVRVAIVPAARARGLFRGGDVLHRLFTAVAALAGPLLRFDVEVVLAPGAAPRMRLGDPQSARLGADSWLIHHHHGPHTVLHDDPG